MVVRKITNEEFTKFADKFNEKSIYQTKEYASIMAKQQANSIFIGLEDNGKIIAATYIYIKDLNGFDYAYAPHGILIDYNDYKLLKFFSNGMSKILKKMNVMAIKISPIIIRKIYNSDKKEIYNNPNYDKIYHNLKSLGYYHIGYNNKFESLKPRFYAIINLEKNIYDLFNNDIKNEYKTKIRSANNNGITIYKGNSTNLKNIYELTKKNYNRDLNYYNDCYHFFEERNMIEYYYAKLDINHFLKIQQEKYQEALDISEKFNKEFIQKSKTNSSKMLSKKIYLEEQVNKTHKNLIDATNTISLNPEGLAIAAAITIKYDDTVYILIDGYNKKYKRFNAKHLLIWKLIEKYNKEGYKKFNLGGLPNINVNTPYDGLVQFKLNFGANVYEYAGDFELITDAVKFFIYRNASPLRKLLQKK